MKRFKILLAAILIHGFGSCSLVNAASLSISPYDIQSLAGPNNLVKNPFAEGNDRYVSGTASHSRDGLVITLFGKASHICNGASQGQYCEYALKTIVNPYQSGICQFYGFVYGDASLYKAQILDSAGTVVRGETATLGTGNEWRIFAAEAPCQTSPRVRITQTEAGDGGVIYLGVGYGHKVVEYGNLPTTFTARISSSAVVSGQTPNGVTWITGCTGSGTFAKTCTFPSGFFTSAPNCTVSINGATIGEVIIEADTSSLTVRTANSAGSGQATYNSFVSCTKTGADAPVPVVTAPNWNFSARSYTPTITNGPACSTSSYKYSRSGARMIIDGSCSVSGAGAAGSLAISLPSGFTAVLDGVGSLRFYDQSASTTYSGISVISESTSVIYLEITGNRLNGTSFANGDNFQFSLSVPVLENGVPWTETYNAKQIPGSYFSDSDVIQRTDSAIFGGASNSAVCSSAGACNKYGAYTGWFTATRTGTAGVYNIAFTKPYANTNYVCQTSYEQWSSTSTQVPQCLKSSKTTSGFTLTCYSSAGSTDVAVALSCTGQK